MSSRTVLGCVLALVGFGLLVAPAGAEDAALLEKVKQLEEKVKNLSAQQAVLLQEDVDRYLAETATDSAQGSNPLEGITLSARFTAVTQATVGLDLFNRSVVNGDVDLDFDFQVTDDLDIFIHLTASEAESESDFDLSDIGDFDEEIDDFNDLTSNGAFPDQFGSISTPQGSFPSIAGTTFSGLADGVGINGTVNVDTGSITVREAGIHHVVHIRDHDLHWETGAIDPRKRFLQNAFADDENTQFINNLFDDSPSVLWLSTALGNTVFGVHMWISVGADKQFTFNWGWFNSPGQTFNNGQFYFQFHWRTELNGREVNIRLMGFLDEVFEDASGDGGAGGGATGDWWITDKVGIWFRIAVNGDDINPIESDYSVGVQANGLIGSRPDDILGVAVGFIQSNDTVIAFLEDQEVTVEVYYMFSLEDGKLQITPHVMFISDPGGGLGENFDDDQLIVLGLRVFVPF